MCLIPMNTLLVLFGNYSYLLSLVFYSFLEQKKPDMMDLFHSCFFKGDGI